jgi:ABC-2 type transport system permease protein
MLTRIARKEFTDTLRDGRFRWGGVAVLALLLAAVGLGWAHQREVAATQALAEDQTWEHWQQQGAKNPHSAAHYGVYAFKPVSTLSFVDQGVDPYLGVATWLEAHRQNPFEYRPAQDATAIARFGGLSAAGVLQLLVPLLIIFLAFSTVSAERESGTLRQLLSTGVRPRDVVRGKALGVAAALAMLLCPAALLVAAAMVLSSADSAGNAVLPGLLLVLTYSAYFAIFVAVSVAVSARARSSRSALVGLLGFWIVNAMVAPRAAADLAEAAYPLPATVEFEAAIQRTFESGLDGRTPANERMWQVEDSLLAAYGATTRAELPVNYAGVSLQASEEYGNLVFDRHYGELAALLERQQAVHRSVGIGAPVLLVRELSMGLAGTDAAHHWHFANAAEAHRRVIQRILNDDITYNSRWGEDYSAGPDLWARVPRFHYEAPGLAWTLGRQRATLALLLLWFLAALACLEGAARRLRVDTSLVPSRRTAASGWCSSPLPRLPVTPFSMAHVGRGRRRRRSGPRGMGKHSGSASCGHG